MSRAYPTKNEARSYGDGYAQGGKDARLIAQHKARVAAFGAIRRAAEVARQADSRERYWLKTTGDEGRARESRYQASSIRAAIRAAIGSDKA